MKKINGTVNKEIMYTSINQGNVPINKINKSNINE